MQLRIPTIIKGFDTQWSLPQKIKSIVDKILFIDNSISILPWSTPPTSKQPYHSPHKELIPLALDQIATTDTTTLQMYFDRLDRPIKDNDNFKWVDFRLQHTIPWSQMKDLLAARLQKRGYSLYPRQLQSEKEVVIGWLLWSFREQDADLLTKLINKKYKIDTYL
jgi:hypothetical protein